MSDHRKINQSQTGNILHAHCVTVSTQSRLLPERTSERKLLVLVTSLQCRHENTLNYKFCTVVSQ